MIAGLILSNTIEEKCRMAFLGENLECLQAETNKEIVDAVNERDVEFLAVDVGAAQAAEEMTKTEKELKEEGFIFTPNSHQDKKVERLQSLKKGLEHAMKGRIEVIRFEPQITAKELEVTGEEDLRHLGIEGEIGEAKEFDAVLGAITARHYQKGDYQDLGVIIPGREEVEEE